MQYSQDGLLLEDSYNSAVYNEIILCCFPKVTEEDTICMLWDMSIHSYKELLDPAWELMFCVLL